MGMCGGTKIEKWEGIRLENVIGKEEKVRGYMYTSTLTPPVSPVSLLVPAFSCPADSDAFRNMQYLLVAELIELSFIPDCKLSVETLT